MIASGSDYLARWRSGVYPVRQKAEIFIPVPIIAAAASGEDSSDWPASAVYDADRTHINAGPGPLAPNFIGRGEWKSPSVQSGSVQFTMNKRVQWRGTPYVVNTYHDAILGTWYSALPGKEPYRKIHGFWPLGDYGSPSYTSAATLRDVMANYSLAGDGYYIADTPIPGPSNRVDTLGYPTMIAGKGSLNSKSSLKSPGGETVRGFTPALLPYERYDDPTRYDFTWTWWVKNVTGSTILLLWQTPGGSPGTRPVWTVVVAPTTVQATYDPPAGLPLTSLV
ncbi:MAG TPA: hypothetical protein VNI57_01505, partial [Candidatus Saccharimonadales bacterium]|nr:hypothetical protein [Candidatus Saccharimonadales bacterium]